MTSWKEKRTWLGVAGAMLALVFAWSAPASAGAHGKKDEALDKALKSASQVEYRVIIETVDHQALSGDLAIKAAGGRKIRELVSFPGHVVTVTAKQLDKLEKSPLVKNIYLDRRTAGEMNYTAVTTGARTVQWLMGYNGAGIGVAVIDSGVTPWHDDLTYNGLNSKVRVVGGQRVAGFVDFVNGRTDPYDDHGHGTHVAGIIAGNGYDTYGSRAGMAPASHLVALKVLDATGAGYMSDVMAALDWTVAHKDEYGVRIVNLSVGAPVTASYWTDPLTLAAKRAVESGLVVVAAAGNAGKNAAGAIQYGGIIAPGNAPWVLTVGASSHMGTIARADDTIAPFSSRGPSAIDYRAKPDLVAPGAGIVSLSANGSTLYSTQSNLLLNGFRSTSYKPYLSLSGTSMAAPVVAGAVAQILQANPALTPNAVKAILQYTSQDNGDSALAQGAGYLNAFGAVELARYFRIHPVGSRYPSSPFWTKTIIWGNYEVSGGVIMPNATAWALNIVWGTMADGDNIVWGTSCGTDTDCNNLVWGTDIGLDSAGDNIVWGTIAGLDGDNIVWGTFDAADGDNIVWGTDCGGADCTGVVWGALTGLDGDNIVWGTAQDGDNIVWGTAADGDNIVWGTSDASGDNIVWGTSDGSGDNIVWGTSPSPEGDTTIFGTASDGDNIVWGTSSDVTLGDDGALQLIVSFETLFAAPAPEPVATTDTMTGAAAATTSTETNTTSSTSTSEPVSSSDPVTSSAPIPGGI